MTFLDKLITRRDVLRAGSTAAAFAALPSAITRYGIPARFANDVHVRAAQRAIPVDADAVRDLVHQAIDAARQAGATYAEARITRTVSESFMGPGLYLDVERLGIGVRVLVDGAWGFAASPYCDTDEAVHLGRDAVAQARYNAKISTRRVELVAAPAVQGTWRTPIRIDPFTLPLEEKTDFVASIGGLLPKHLSHRSVTGGLAEMVFGRQERAIGNSDGTYCTQTLYVASGKFPMTVRLPDDRLATVLGRGLNAAGAGWELILDAKLREQIPGLIDEATMLLNTPHKPVQIGRYDVVCDAGTMASLINVTLGKATQIDRALGYEANATGTSYLGPDPLAHLGTTVLGSPLLTVTGDRQMPGGLATVKWDDEGVEPDAFPIVSQGQVVDYQTTREQVGWLAPWYQKRGRPARSHGCAWSHEAFDLPVQTTPNLTLAPGTSDVGFAQLVSGIKKGLAITQGVVSADFQSRNGSGAGMVREITNGKLGAIIDGSAFLFDSMQLWKTLVAVGGPSSQERFGSGEVKGQPAQVNSHSIMAVPAVLKDLIIVDSRGGF